MTSSSSSHFITTRKIFPICGKKFSIPISYTAERDRAEQILLECAARLQIENGIHKT